MPPHITTNCLITNKHYVNDLKIALQNANKSGNDLKVVTQDGSVYIRKDVLVIWSPLFQDILSSISEPKISISLNDVSIDSVKNIKTIMMSGEVKKNLNHAEIQGVIHAGHLLGINLENVSNSVVNQRIANDSVEEGEISRQTPTTIFNDPHVKNEAGYDQEDFHNRSGSGEYMCSPPAFSTSTPLKMTFKKKDSNQNPDTVTLDDVIPGSHININNNILETALAAASIPDQIEMDFTPAPIPPIQLTKSKTNANFTEVSKNTETPAVISLPGLNQSVSKKTNTTSTLVSNPSTEPKLHECPFCLYKTEDLSSIKKHYKDIHKEKYKDSGDSGKEAVDHPKKSKHIDDIPPKYFCPQCPYKTHKSSLIKDHAKDKHKTLFVFECDHCDYRSTERHRTRTDGHSCSKLCLRCGRWHTSSYLCSFSDDVRCLVCSKVGHVRFLHYPETIKNYNLLKTKLKNANMNIEIEKPNKESNYEFRCKHCSYSTDRAILIAMHTKDSHGQLYIYTCSKCNYPPTTKRRQFMSHICSPDIHGFHEGEKPNSYSLSPSSTVVHPPSINVPSTASSQTASNDLCLICGGHHGPQCNFTFESKCERCGKDGHVESLHTISSYEDFKIIKTLMPDLQLSFKISK